MFAVNSRGSAAIKLEGFGPAKFACDLLLFPVDPFTEANSNQLPPEIERYTVAAGRFYFDQSDRSGGKRKQSSGGEKANISDPRAW